MMDCEYNTTDGESRSPILWLYLFHHRLKILHRICKKAIRMIHPVLEVSRSHPTYEFRNSFVSCPVVSKNSMSMVGVSVDSKRT